MENAPIVLTVYKRPEHTLKTLEALKKNVLAKDSILYVFCDGPKYGAEIADINNITRVREIVKSQQWCGKVEIRESVFNSGLVKSFVNSITEVVNKHGRVIVLEDDQVTSVGFLTYMNAALELYKDDKKVMNVSGYMYPATNSKLPETFFLNVQTCPGWGTWKRAWGSYNHDAHSHVNYFMSNKKALKHFDLGGHALWYAQLYRNTIEPGFSFAVRWYASCYRENGLTLFPSKSLVKNIGIDGTGEHCSETTLYDVELVDKIKVERVPIEENTSIRDAISKHYKRYHTPGIRQKINLYYQNSKGYLRDILRFPILRLFPELNLLRHLDESTSKKNIISPKSKIYFPNKIMNSEIGDYTYISSNSVVTQTKIGKYCSIGPNLLCGWGIHPMTGISTSPMFYSTLRQNGITLSSTNKVQERKEIVIGNDVFIGMNVTILDGVTIGDGAVIGAGCVVSKDVPPYGVAVGCPMKISKYRFDSETIEKMLKIKWWDWPEDKLQEVERMFFNVDEFVNFSEGEEN